MQIFNDLSIYFFDTFACIFKHEKKNTLNFEYISTTKKLFNYVLFQNKPKLRKTCFKLTLNVFLQKYDLFHKATDNP